MMPILRIANCTFCLGLLLHLTIAAAAEVRIDSLEVVDKTIAQAGPGDVLVLPDGLYKDLRIAFKAEGKPDKPITLHAQTPGKVTITGKASFVISGQWLVVKGLVFDQAWGSSVIAFNNARHCRLTDCAFVECGNPNSTFSHTITLRDRSQQNRIDHCYMQGNLSMGIGVVVSSNNHENTDNTVDHNYFKDIVGRWSNGQEVVQVGQGSYSTTQDVRTLVEFCLFENTNGDCEAISNKSRHNTYRYNTFRDCRNAELVLRGGSHALVQGNFFFNGLGGVRVHDGHHRIINNYFENVQHVILMRHGDASYAPVEHCVVAHNTMVNCKQKCIRLGEVREDVNPNHPNYLPPLENSFINNLMVGNRGTLIEKVSGKGTTWQGNIVWATGKATQGLKSDGLEAADPKLLKKGGVYRLPATGSPAIDSAVAMPEPVKDDMDGQSRDGKPDVGCDEVSSAPVLRRPLSSKDVGPMWMQGDPTRIKRISSPKPIPKIERKK